MRRLGLVLGALIIATTYAAALALALAVTRHGMGALFAWAIATLTFALLAARYLQVAEQRHQAHNLRRESWNAGN